MSEEMGMDRRIQKKKWPPKKIATLALVTLFILFVIYLFIFKLSKSALNVEAEKIDISTVERGPFQEYIPVVGNVMPINTFYLDAVEGGRVEKIYIEAGTQVNKGDKILKLANTNLLLTIMWREAELFQQSNNLRSTRLAMEEYRLSLNKELADVESQLKQQEALYKRQKELFKDSLISEYEFEIAKNQYEYLVNRKELTVESQKTELAFRQAQIDALETSLVRMQKNLEVIKEQYENLTIKAPVSGLLSSLTVEIGQSKEQGQRLGQIDVLEGFKVRAEIDEHYISRIEVGKSGEFDLSNSSYSLIVKKVYPEVKEGKFEVDLEFKGKEPPGLRRGQTLHIRLELSEISEAVLLPRGGFYQETGGNWIYLVDKSAKFATKRQIKLGRQNPQVFEVLEGLLPGDRVITSSYETFNNIDRLILK